MQQRCFRKCNPDLKPIDSVDHWIPFAAQPAAAPTRALQPHLAEPGQFLRDFIDFFSRCQDELVSPDDYERYADEQAENFPSRARRAMPEDERRTRDEEIAKLQEVARAYRASDLLLRERKMLTFGSQIMDAVMRLRDDDALCATNFARATDIFWWMSFRIPTSRN